MEETQPRPDDTPETAEPPGAENLSETVPGKGDTPARRHQPALSRARQDGAELLPIKRY